jgi:hypothetical protein
MGMSARRRVQVEIGELVLHGFDRGQRDEIAAVRAGLAAALEGWHPAAGASAAHLEAGSFAVPAAAGPGAVGHGVARQIHRALSGGLHAGTMEGGH